MKKHTACFTGHRIIERRKLPQIERRLTEELETCIENGYRYFGAGGALGFDTLAAQTVLRLKRKHPHIRLILVLPCRDQTAGWKKEDVEIYEAIKKRADKIVYTSEKYYDGCMHKRNRHLVDSSSLCICCCNGKPGGTAYTVQYAAKKGLKIVNVFE